MIIWIVWNDYMDISPLVPLEGLHLLKALPWDYIPACDELLVVLVGFSRVLYLVY